MDSPITVIEAALIAKVHRQTIADALREGALHGGQNKKRGTWRIMPGCLEAWMVGDKCSHRQKAAA